MPLPPKQFFTLAEVAERWGCSEQDVLAYAMDGQVMVSVWVLHAHVEVSESVVLGDGGKTFYPFIEQYRTGLLPLDIKDVGLLWSYGKAEIRSLADTPAGDRQKLKRFHIPGLEGDDKTGLPMTPADVRLSGEEVRQFEKRHQIKVEDPNISPTQFPSHSSDADRPYTGRHGVSNRHRDRAEAVARALWAQNPKIPCKEMIKSPAVLDIACEGKAYAAKTLRNWLAPFQPGQ
ncbi:hypothetical protein [Magnetofaba australis]|nr:hypothetical protein [Magnetofaba australis]